MKSILLRVFILVFIASISLINANAQATLNGNPDKTWQDMMLDPSANFFETKQKFEQYWQGREVTRGSGYKAFKRWEWFMESRVDAQGNRPRPDAVWQAMQQQPDMFDRAAVSTTGIWSYIGNTSIPTGGGGAGRINGVRELPGSTTTFFACAPGGGLWKTVDSGTSWSMVGTDFLGSIGCSDVAIDPSNTNVMYLATGDGDAGDTYALGVLKSTDGGSTWNTTGLSWGVTLVRTTSRILINPNNTQIVLCSTSNGVYRTTDGGANWTQTVSGNFKDLVMKPGDPTTWYASSNQLYRSTDGGVSWTVLTSGLPTSANTQRMSVAITAADANVVYVLASGNDSGLLGIWKSTNGGASFTQMTGTNPNYLNWDTSATATTGGQGWYDLRIAADPTNANTIVIGGVNVWKSTNGGTNFSLIGHWYGGGGAPYVHADIHAIHFVPNSTRLLIGNDGGVFMTTNGGTSFSDISSNLPIAQIYRLSVAGTNNNVVISGWQDNGTNLKNGTTHTRPIGGDGMDCQINASNASIMYGELYYGSIFKSTNGGASFTNIVGSGGANEDEDGAWVTPFVLGPNPNHIYVGKSLVFKSLDGGTTFTGSAAFGGTGDCNYIAVAPSNTNIVYASKGGSLFKSIDNAVNFTQVAGMQGSFITSFCIHNTDPNKVWVTYSNYTAGQKIYYTANGGTSWTNISGSLPNLPANVVVFQPGTNNGIYVGMDAGVYYRDEVLGSFVPYINALPNAEVVDLDVQLGTNTITACTYGRGIWRAPLYTLPALDGVMSAIISPTGSSCSSTVTPEIQILNAGTTTLTSMAISYQVSGQTAQTYNWTGSLATGATQNITLPSVNYGSGSFTFTATVLSVNGQADANTVNNSQSSSYFCVNGVNNATITLETDCYGNEISWQIKDAADIVVHSGAGYGNEQTYTIPVCLATECYTFVINDSYGDGISGNGCGQGAGNYFITDNASGATLVTMTTASYGFGTSHSLCYPVGQVLGCTNNTACNYNALATQDNGSCTFGPANDLCAGAVLLQVNAAATASTNVGTCLEGSNPNCGGTGIKDVWFKFVYAGGPVTITTDFTGGTMNDTRLAVWSACGGTQLYCNDDIGGTNYKSTITVPCGALTLGVTYFIQAGGYNAATGTFSIRVTAPVETCNGVDDNCNGQIDEGFDVDGDGYTTCAGDCNDANNAINPGATEICNTADDDCDGQINESVGNTYYADTDGDGYGNAASSTVACTQPSGYVSNSNDCDDNNNAINIGATEVCNTADDDCDGQINEGVGNTYYADTDSDGYGNAASSTVACTQPSGYVSNSNDCDDNNNAVNSGATEICNTADDDCDGQINEGVGNTYFADTDGDGYGNAASTTVACTQPSGFVSNSSDCNDANSAINPGATEICNTDDDDCDGQINEGVGNTYYADTDGDGYGNAVSTTVACTQPSGYVSNSSDCNDANSAINTGASEICDNGLDDNCSGATDEGCCAVVASSVVSNVTCSGLTDGGINVTVSSGLAPFTYLWNNGLTTEDLSNVAQGTYNVIITAANGCQGTLSASLGNNNLTQTAPTAINGPNGVCRNSTGNVFTTPAVTGATSYLWTLPTGATGTSTTNSITLSFGSTYNTGNLSVRAVGPCGTSVAFTRSVAAYTAVPTSPTAITGPTVNVCAGSTQSYSCSTVATATSYQWTAPTNATIVSGQGTPTVTIAFASNFGVNGTIIVRSQNCFGLSSNRTLAVYNIPATPATITGAANNICPGTQSYSILAVPGATSYLWTAPTNATITAGQGTNIVTVSYGASFVSGSLTVRAVSTCGQSAARSLTVSKSPTTTAVISGQSSNLCGGGQFTYTIASVIGAVTYNWTAPAGCTIASSNLNTVTINVPSSFTTGTLSVACVNGCGGSITRTLALTRLPATPASITGPASVCPSQVGVNFTTPAVAGVTNTWTAPTGATITAGQNTTSMTCTWGTAAGSVTVRGVNACGQSATRSKALTLLACIDEQEEGAIDNEVRANEISIYPNPNSGTFAVRVQQAGSYEVLNSLGQIQQVITINESVGSFEVAGLASGMYFVREVRNPANLQRVVVVQY